MSLGLVPDLFLFKVTGLVRQHWGEREPSTVATSIERAKSVLIIARGNEGRMNSGIKQTGPLGGETAARRANRRLNGMGARAGVPDPPMRGRLTRTLALLDAALRVWEANQPRPPAVWRHKPR